jgi:hypothetical protein
MPTLVLKHTALQNLTHDGWLLFLTRFVRLFAYGSLSVVLVLYLISLGLSESQTGVLLTPTLAGLIVKLGKPISCAPAAVNRITVAISRGFQTETGN